MSDQRIHLLFIVNSLHFGGAEKHVVTLLNSLDAARFKLSLVYLKDQNTLLSQLDLKKLQGRLFCGHVNSKLDLRAARYLADYVRDEAVDIVVCTNTYSLLYGWLARHLSGKNPRLIDVFHSTKMGSWRDKLKMWFYRPFFRRCDMLVYVCQNQRKYWQARSLKARNDMVIMNGIDVSHFKDCYTVDEKLLQRREYGFFADDYVVGLCAALRPEKAHLDLIKAISQLNNSGLQVKCLLIGDGPEREKIEGSILSLGLASQVRITGYMEDVRPAIAACDVMTLTSNNETFSIAALEAMALSKPMIMSDVGGASEQVEHGENGLLYPPQNVMALADALRILSDPKMSVAMGGRARRVTEQNFSLTAMAEAYGKLFTQMAEAERAPVSVRVRRNAA